jgi:hypothetical protein
MSGNSREADVGACAAWRSGSEGRHGNGVGASCGGTALSQGGEEAVASSRSSGSSDTAPVVDSGWL